MNARSQQTILAVGAHCGDIEITCGAVLAKHAAAGDRVVMLHMTLGEGGNPAMSPQSYGDQKRHEALAAAQILGSEVLFGPYKDGELPDDEPTRRYVAEVVRKVKPSLVITHWSKSIHPDHARTHTVAMDAVLLASLEGVVLDHPRHRGVNGVFFMENWEDPEGFDPYMYVNVTGVLERWKECVTKYEFIGGSISSFPYLDYYEALARVRGAEAGTRHAVAFDVDRLAKRKVVDFLL